MSAGRPSEGRVALTLRVEGGCVRRAEVGIQRPTAAARILVGRPVGEALRLVPLLFAVCGLAQGVAAVAAVEAALAVPPPASPHAAARALLALAETAANHARHLLIDSPRLIGADGDARTAAACHARAIGLSRALYPDGDAFVPGGGRLAPDPRALEALVEALDAAAAAPTPALDAYLSQPERAGFGGSPVGPLPPLPASWFARALAEDAGFSALPRLEEGLEEGLEGGAAHTGALARMMGEPAVAQVLHDWGPGLLAHHTARRVELARLRGDAPRLIAALEPTAPAPPPTTSSGEGAGVVETARGRLAHWVRVEGGRVAAWRTVAPTEWNFHPAGPLARGLAGVAAGPELEREAGLFIAALDPCVAWSLTVLEGTGRERPAADATSGAGEPRG